MTRQEKKILLVGNYSLDGSESMNRYVALLQRALSGRGYAVRVVTPPQIVGRLGRQGSGLGKWLGYVDKFLFFPWQLLARARTADIVHICDQGSASYTRLFRNRPTVLTCHDMFAIRAGLETIPEHSLKLPGKVFQAANRRGLELADSVICISDHTRDEVLEFTKCDPEAVRAAYLPLNYPYSPAPSEEIERTVRQAGLDPSERYFFHVGGNFPYKNRPGVVRIFSELRKLEDYRSARLIMAGARWSPELRQVVVSLELDSVVVEVETPSNEDLRALYSGALALIFPSLYEGFGWPLVEAQACGCPVATSNRPPMSDLVRESGVLFDPLDHAGAATRIAEGLADRAGLRRRGMANVARFSPETMLSEVQAAYTQAETRKRARTSGSGIRG